MDIEQKIIALLLEKGLISQDTLDEIKILSFNTGDSILNILLKRQIITPDELLALKAEIYRVPYVNLSGRGISPDILTLIPEPVARKYKLIPFEYDKKTQKLSIALINPLDLPLVEFLEQKSGKSIVCFLAKEDEIIEKIDEEYSQGLADDVSEALKETTNTVVKSIQEGKINQVIKEAPIAKIVSTLVGYAIKSRASDIHLEPQEKQTRVRYRIDGILQEKLILPKSVHDAVISRIKIISGMKIDERRVPQDGRFNYKVTDEEVDLRVSSLPTTYGEKIVMRLLKKTGGVPTFAELGLRGSSLKNLETAITRPHGIILITGPTGSGKTTSLYSILSKLNTTKVNIVTLEDPVEYEIPGVNQVQINPTAGLTFASGLRSFLRQDPNIILVGEIRDKETTALAIQAALTGHLVFSTLHTNNAATSIPRLLDLGAEPFLVVSVVNAVVAQRIVRTICKTCKDSYIPLSSIIEDIKKVLGKLYPLEGKEVALFRGKGCKECNNTGYLGRVGIFETITISSEIAKLILERSSVDQIEKQAISEGVITLKQDGYLKVLEGLTTIEEVIRVAEE